MAQTALEAYGLGEARLTFVSHTGNTVFRAHAPNPASVRVAHTRYAENQYVLRIHQPGYQSTEAIVSELEWLSALRREELPVPEPVPTLDGDIIVQVGTPGVPEVRTCSLLRWMKGRMLSQGLRLCHFQALGQLMAQLHDHTARWQPPKGFTRPHWDWEGLYGDTTGIGIPARELWPLMPRHDLEPFEKVTKQVRQVMDELGEGRDVFGLIHSDLAAEYNVLFGGGEARPIDFDDCAYGYWMYDIASTLSDWQEVALWPKVRDAVLGGYTKIRSLPEEQLARLDLFMAARHATVMLWATATAHNFPQNQEAATRRREEAARHVRRYLKADEE